MSIETAINDLQQGKMIILTDHPNRENEGDLIFPAEYVTPEKINFMLKHCSGIICLSLTEQHLQKLNIPLMVPADKNTNFHQTPFTLSIEAKAGITTGVSAFDRTKTIQAVMHDQATSNDIASPGHIFPLQAKEGGVLVRAGHTEGSVDIMRLAGLKPAAVICELMNTDGSMMRGEKLRQFADAQQLTILSIQEIIEYRRQHENLITDTVTTTLPLDPYGVFKMMVMKEKYSPKEHMILFKENIDVKKEVLVRIHSSCTTGDIFHSQRCDCRAQLDYALQQITHENGLLIYSPQEGRDIGLFNKIRAYALQDQGLDTVEANQQLNLPVDAREYYFAAQILNYFNIRQIYLLTNNPKKLNDLKKYGDFTVAHETMPHFSNSHNQFYLQTKQEKLHHYATT